MLLCLISSPEFRSFRRTKRTSNQSLEPTAGRSDRGFSWDVLNVCHTPAASRGSAPSRWIIHEAIKRFRYRFQLWRREQRDASFWRPSPRPAGPGEPPVWQNPKYEILWTDPPDRNPRVSLYVAIVLIISSICILIDRFSSSARHAVGIAFLWLVGLWTFLSLLMAIDMVKKRRAYRLKPWKSSNKSLQPTATVSIRKFELMKQFGEFATLAPASSG